MEKHSEEVMEFRREMVKMLRELDSSKFSQEDTLFFLLSLCYDVLTYIQNTGGSDRNGEAQ